MSLGVSRSSLDKTYEQALENIYEADRKYARRLFQCIAMASRPLSVEELAEFFAFDCMSGQFLIRARVGVQKTQEKLQDLSVQV